MLFAHRLRFTMLKIVQKTSVFGQQNCGLCDLLDSNTCQRKGERDFGQLWPVARVDRRPSSGQWLNALTPGQTEGKVILSVLVWKVGTHLRLHLAWPGTRPYD